MAQQTFIPKYVAFINVIENWNDSATILSSLGVPTFASSLSKYNIFNLAFWKPNQKTDMIELWQNINKYLSTSFMMSLAGSTNVHVVQQKIIDLYHSQGKRLQISLFGGTCHPVTDGYDAVQIAQSVANFVIINKLDGVDVDLEDENAYYYIPSTIQWINTLTTNLRNLLPSPQYTISHTLGVALFGKGLYPNGGYISVNQAVGNLIDWYGLQYYGGQTSVYTTYNSLFISSTGWALNTAVKQISSFISPAKLVVGKPATTADATSGYVNPSDLLAWSKTYIKNTGQIFGGFATWQYRSDSRNSFNFITNVSQYLS